jgi:hypothetical protein
MGYLRHRPQPRFSLIWRTAAEYWATRDKACFLRSVIHRNSPTALNGLDQVGTSYSEQTFAEVAAGCGHVPRGCPVVMRICCRIVPGFWLMQWLNFAG